MSYGTVRQNNSGMWCIKTQPQVRLRLKRVFERIDKRDHDWVFLGDTPENCRELLWFLQRFPMDMPDEARAYLAAQAQAYDERQLTIRQVLDAVIAPRAFTMALPPRDYQAQAAEMLLRSGRLLCADDVGLGKTALAIAALTDPATRPALVVALTHLQRQWVIELAKFAPGLKAHILKRGSPYPIEPFPDVIVSSYHKLGGWADVLAPVIKTVVFDEAQELRRTESRKYSAAAHLAANARYCLGLSATPIYNYGSEMYSVMNCIAPDALGSRQEFGREWCASGDWGPKAKIGDPKAFGSYLRDQGLMLRRTRKDVGRELPEVTRVVHEIEANHDALEQVSITATDLARTILAQGEAFRGQKLQASEELSMLLRQATGVAKAPHVAAFVRLLCESEGKVVLYGWHKAVYALWRDALAELKPVFYTGDESPNEKDASKKAFVEGDSKVLIISLRAGMGLDGLQQVCRTVVFGELDWSPGVHEQCIGRIHRDGQAEPVLSYFLVADAGSDPVVSDINGIKRQQSEAIRDPHADLIEKLTVDSSHVRRLAAEYLEQRGLAA